MAAPPNPSSLLQQRPFVLFWLARVASTVGYQMLAVLIGWKVYEITGSAFDLGLVGLIQFVPAVVLTLLIGLIAGRYDRRLIVRLAQSVYVVVAALIPVALSAGVLSRDLLFVVVFLIGCARAFEMPTIHALVPALVPGPLIPRAIAAWTSANQVAVICGPALGGLIYALSPILVSAICLLFFSAAITLISMAQPRGRPENREPATLASVLEKGPA
jgi:MFS family permease